jgi:hypothetical protein
MLSPFGENTFGINRLDPLHKTFMVTCFVVLHPCAVKAVAVYCVVSTGFAKGCAQLLQDSEVGGVHSHLTTSGEFIVVIW